MTSRVCQECGKPIQKWDYCRRCAENFEQAAYESLEKAYHDGRYTFSEYERLRRKLDQINWGYEDG